ncbi:16S rRNA (adenine(1518)-N(6)/adenine(1519)-N(6))-dimethyltransferase RsmA [Cloacibacillus porcorum]|uniref:16S rRNA (adenine(1518)-N(6)/adenine(1519)-N(6))- dimethyltransferase RsmA n=1 Tax=Cloacibacillus porcorum TaxID=1197717 RepID=UPI002589F0C2|nr:16S rRNA (adenine(1518)-N(6)/adenine(1519)-N(6))-dimethyltransferase RsmA [Cloacibacillus porcorum]
MADNKRHFIHNTDIGQNFLIDRGVVEFILKRSAPTAEDVVLEIGPGDGVLTRGLLSTPLKALYSVEVDERLREGLDKIAARDGRCTCFWGDAVQFDYVRALPEPPTKIIANLPYHITTPLMWAFLEQLVPAKTDYMLLMVQLESAERIASPAGHRERSPLGITVEAMGSAEVVRKIPPTAFNPQPRVNSALIEIKIEKNRELANDRTWRGLLARSFTRRRKTLANNWAAGYSGSGVTRERAFEILAAHGLKPTARAEELTLDKWFALAEVPDFRLKNKNSGE